MINLLNHAVGGVCKTPLEIALSGRSGQRLLRQLCWAATAASRAVFGVYPKMSCRLAQRHREGGQSYHWWGDELDIDIQASSPYLQGRVGELIHAFGKVLGHDLHSAPEKRTEWDKTSLFFRCCFPDGELLIDVRMGPAAVERLNAYLLERELNQIQNLGWFHQVPVSFPLRLSFFPDSLRPSSALRADFGVMAIGAHRFMYLINATRGENGIDLEFSPQKTGDAMLSTLSPISRSIMKEVRVELTVELGEIQTTFAELLSITQGRILTFHLPTEALVTLKLADVPLARGRLVPVGEQLGVEILEYETSAAAPISKIEATSTSLQPIEQLS